jgi:hypothetical protein
MPPGTYSPREPKFENILCQCGCGEHFMGTVTTNRPKYKNDTHKQRAARKRKPKPVTPRSGKDLPYFMKMTVVKRPVIEGVAEFPTEKEAHKFLNDMRKIFGDIEISHKHLCARFTLLDEANGIAYWETWHTKNPNKNSAEWHRKKRR